MSTTVATTSATQPQYEYFYQDGRFGAKREVLTGNKAFKTFTEIPIVDLAPAYSDKLEVRKQVARKIAEVFETVGFIYIKNHGVDQAIIDEAYRVTKEYFDLPTEKKMQNFNYKNDGLRGYEALYSARLDERFKKGEKKEGYTFSYDEEWDMVPPNLTEAQRALHYINQWPDDFFPEFKKGMMTYWSHMLTLGRRLMRLFALGLDVNEGYFDNMMRAPLATIRTHRYSPMDPNNENENGIGAHTDFETFTMLSQDSTGGLEILNLNAQWIPAPPIEGTFVVNVGDWLQQASNGRFVSTVHRVKRLTGNKPRYSIPFFFGLDFDAYCEVLPTCQSPDNPPRYKPLNIKEYLVGLRKKQEARLAKRKAEVKAGIVLPFDSY
ncbi:hypothetical protein BP5796_02066 [Coleophoma crateriformis]|uniref:Fe2OG dioxygenase domain-containing protein n=1 Tax=Coleophoma crateriformis TaxID=565419 RepID=A0A3D8T271_9HELO|nr:hypothetical protein BP5796_02066 [Coleophoma crateriformis]